MWITHSSPLLSAIDQIQLATTYAWTSNQPDSKYYEADESVRNRHLSDLDKACLEYLKLRKTTMKTEIVELANKIGL